MKPAIRLSVLAIVSFIGFSSLCFAQTDPDRIDFVTQVKPLLEKHCMRCHGPEVEEGGVRVDRKSYLIDVYIQPGEDPSESDFFELLVTDDEDFRMPPVGEGELTADEITVFRKWIDQGADWPDDVTFNLPAEEPSDDDTLGQGSDPESKDGDQASTAERATKPISVPKKSVPENFWVALWENIGVLHPAIVHFPVAMLIGGALFALFGFRGDSPLGDAAYYCLWLAALSGILASVVGWSYAEYYHRNAATWDDFDFSKTIVQHRWLGILLSVLTLILAFIARSNRRGDPYASGWFWKCGMLVLAGLCGYIGYLGGEMTHRGEVERALKNMGLIDQTVREPVLNPQLEDEDEADALDEQNDDLQNVPDENNSNATDDIPFSDPKSKTDDPDEKADVVEDDPPADGKLIDDPQDKKDQSDDDDSE